MADPDHPKHAELTHWYYSGQMSVGLGTHSDRRSEMLGARWEQFELEATVWIKPAATTKQRRPHRADQCFDTALLRARLEQVGDMLRSEVEARSRSIAVSDQFIFSSAFSVLMSRAWPCQCVVLA